MTRQRYNTTETWNRILRLWQGKAVATDQPATMQGEILSVDEAQSDWAELQADSLPNESLQLPAGLYATVAEANAGTDTVAVMTPASHTWAHEYGGIYVSTGTNSSPNQIIAATTWTKITGTFKGSMLDSGAEITCNPANDRIVINEVGTYFVAYQLSLLNNGDAVTINALVYENSLPQFQTHSSIAFGASGTVDASKSLVAFGNVSVAALAEPVELYLYASAATTIKVMAGQLTVQKMVG